MPRDYVGKYKCEANKDNDDDDVYENQLNVPLAQIWLQKAMLKIGF